jgi:hypothetical protein
MAADSQRYALRTSVMAQRSVIIQGTKAPVHCFPYFVLLNNDYGGSLIAPDIVL